MKLRDGCLHWRHLSSFPKTWLVVTTTIDWVSTNKKTNIFFGLIHNIKNIIHPKPDFNQPTCMLPGLLLILVLACHIYFFYILWQPCYGRMFIPLSIDKSSIAYPSQPLNGKEVTLHDHIFIFFRDALVIRTETRLQIPTLSDFIVQPDETHSSKWMAQHSISSSWSIVSESTSAVVWDIKWLLTNNDSVRSVGRWQ